MGLRHVMREVRPDLVLSGVNRGQNVAEDVTYSGTVAGAMEGTILGVPSIALSQAYGPGGRNAIRWQCAEAHAPAVVRKILEVSDGYLVLRQDPAQPLATVQDTVQQLVALITILTEEG